ncbi:Uncharacterised protein [Mycobacteroides abscessus subsp. abscessus]|nr:Uncharacterised protein [Mycobacteroides abscessus subsp. abscessus]
MLIWRNGSGSSGLRSMSQGPSGARWASIITIALGGICSCSAAVISRAC